jgi:hypothetical protein
MILDFYKKALPSKGVYCLADIDPETKRTRHKFVESVDDLITAIEDKKQYKTNIFVALSSFSGYSRKADEAQYVRSFFVDLDVGPGKGYDTKEEALAALDAFVVDAELPPPVRIDSGGGVHAYWIFDEDIPAHEWKPYAEKFKQNCLDHGLHIDPVVTADLARILRCPDTFNYKTEPPIPTKLLDSAISVYVFNEFKRYLGSIKEDPMAIIQAIPKGMTEEQRRAAGMDNFENSFEKILIATDEGRGCAQIKYAIENRTQLTEPVWRAALSIAQHCTNRIQAIRIISEGHPDYDEDAAIQKAAITQDKPYACDTFNKVNPGICTSCPNWGKITNPLVLGKEFIQAPVSEQGEVVEVPHVQGTTVTKIKALPQELYPFVYGQNGGIYYLVRDEDDETGERTHKPVLISTYDLFPTKRIFSITDGECLLMKTILPNDPEREFLLPLKSVYAADKFKDTLASNGVLFNPGPREVGFLMQYVIKWGQYLMSKSSAEVMRMQMGWTPNRDAFVLGGREITREGKELASPTSPLCKGVAKHLTTAGSYENWKQLANELNRPGLELHAFTLLCGFASPMMEYTSTSGVTISLTGESGAAKTGALYANLSIWGHPKDLSVLDATENGMTGRFLALHNLPFGLDEVGNMIPKTLSQLIHKIAQGKSKIRMQASVNAEREHEMSASLIAVFTSNHSLYDKLASLKSDPNGEVARLIEISIRKPQVLKDNPHLGREIFDKFRFNYGWAGPHFVRAVYNTGDYEIEKIMDYWASRFKQDFGEDTAYRFYENLISATMTSGEIANKAGIINIDVERVYRVIVGEMISIRDNVVKINSVNYESVLSDFINKNQTGILAFKDNKVTSEPRTALCMRVESDLNRMWISKTEFDKYLHEMNISTTEFLFQINALGISVKAGREVTKRMNAGWKDISKAATRVYLVDLNTFPHVKDYLDGSETN